MSNQSDVERQSGPTAVFSGLGRRFVRTSWVSAVALLVVYVVAIAVTVPEILSAQTALDVGVAMLPLLIVVIGQTFVMIVAGIDLSATAVMGMSSVVAASIMTTDGGMIGDQALSVPLAMLAFVLVGGLIGLINGVCVAAIGMPAFMVTLANMLFMAGAAVWYASAHTTSVSIGDLPAGFRAIGYGGLYGIPYALVIAAGVAILAQFALTRTAYGRWLFAIGLNPRAAIISGVATIPVTVSAYVVSGLTAGLASLIYTSRIETGTPVIAGNLMLDIVGAAVIGGVSLFGGRGSVLSAIIGVLFLTVVDKGLQLMGLSLFMVLAVKGLLILVAAVLDVLRIKWAAA